jgi:hypothetical protein
VDHWTVRNLYSSYDGNPSFFKGLLTKKMESQLRKWRHTGISDCNGQGSHEIRRIQ